MKRTVIVLLSITTLNAFAYEAGDVIFTNRNQTALNNNDVIQFELRTNNNGLVDTKSLTANPPFNQQVLTHWSFSDQTTYFDVWIRNLSQGQLDYVFCGLNQVRYDHYSVIMIDGYSDGQVVGCYVQE